MSSRIAFTHSMPHPEILTEKEHDIIINNLFFLINMRQSHFPLVIDEFFSSLLN